MFNRILAPLDQSPLAESVFPHVAAFGRAFDAEILLLTVLESRAGHSKMPSIDPLDWQIRKAEAEAYLKRTSLKLQEAGVQSQGQLLEGKAEERIIEYADDQNVNLIILSSHGQSGLSGWNVSSGVQKIILRAHTSIMIVRAYQAVVPDLLPLKYQRLMVPLDGSQRAESVLPAASTLANYYQAELFLVHVVQRPEMPRRTPPTPEDISLAESLTERNRAEAEKYMKELQSRVPGEVTTKLMVSDRANAALHEQSREAGVDLVLLSAHGYSGESRWPYGSVVISFIAYGTTPLLIFQDIPRSKFQEIEEENAVWDDGQRL